MNFLKKLFGGGKPASPESLVEETIQGLLETTKFELDFEILVEEKDDQRTIIANFQGADEEMLKDRNGQVLDALQLYLKRVMQHHLPEDRTHLTVDCAGYRDESEKALIEKAENLKLMALEKGRSVYYRPLPPRERKIVHQYLAQDPRIKSRSLGDGHFKKIKIFPVQENGQVPADSE